MQILQLKLGYIHHSEMDFILNRPLQRFSDSQSYFDSSQFSSYVLNIKLNNNNKPNETFINLKEEEETHSTQATTTTSQNFV